MDDTDKKIIQDNFETLIDVTREINEVILKLVRKGIFNSWMVGFLMQTPGEREKVRNFYQMIQDRGFGAFDNLLKALRETQNLDAVTLLTKNRTETPPLPANTPMKLTSYLPSKTVESSDHDEKNPSVIIERYEMGSQCQGHALIINIKINRKGSEKDAEKLNELFECHSYKVFPYSNLDKQEMEKVIESFITNPALASVSSSVVFIMCHGLEYSPGDPRVKLQTADDDFITSDYVIDQFVSKKCQLTKHGERKPKLFFFISCRVAEDYEYDLNRKVNMKRIKKYASPVSDGSSSDDDVSESASFIDESPDSNSFKSKNNYATYRKYEDIFVVYPNVAGCPSFRDPETGTRFVSAFCRVFGKYSKKLDFCSMMKLVDAEISSVKHKTYGYQSIETGCIGVPKMLFFSRSED